MSSSLSPRAEMRVSSLVFRPKLKPMHDYDYELASPASNGHIPKSQHPSRRHPFRRKAAIQVLAVVLVSLTLLITLGVYRRRRAPDPFKIAVEAYKDLLAATEAAKEDRSPPTYGLFYEMERNLPQHDPSLPFPEGENGRFLWVSNQHWGEQKSLSERVSYLTRSNVRRPWVE